ncbi:DUF2637 domain-containing protein [Micromonospora maritima]|uniref:DUF2637 domain-containing protein n=1 Tax=Micromonospora maritima TaxID=986711 RepID=A0ABW7ZSQ9_9ACTN
MSGRADWVLRALAWLTVFALAGVAGAISFSHMTELALRHGQSGWKAYAFPVSVDGLEIVASLHLVVQRRAGRRTGWIPWVALVVGTLASLAANVAVGGDDLMGKALAGWPALSMLAAVKLLFSMIDHGGDGQRTVWDDQRTAADRPAAPGTVRGTGPDGAASSGLTPDERTGYLGPSASVGTGRSGSPVSTRSAGLPVSVDASAVVQLLAAARAAHAALARDGRSLSRDALADAMRDDGHGVSNARVSLLLKILRAEQAALPGSSVTNSTEFSKDRSEAGDDVA